MAGITNDTLRSYLAKAVPITVDTKMIEKNFPFRIVKRGDFKNAHGIMVNVYIITLADLDPRWIARSTPPFELFHLTGTNECIAKIAAFDYAYLFDQASEEQGKATVNITDSGDIDAINITRNQILSNPERQSLYFRLIFPEILSNDIFSPSAIDGKVKPKLHPVIGKWTTTFKKPDGSSVTKSVESVRTQIQWKVAEHEDVQRNATAFKPNANELLDDATSFLGSMSIE